MPLTNCQYPLADGSRKQPYHGQPSPCAEFGLNHEQKVCPQKKRFCAFPTQRPKCSRRKDTFPFAVLNHKSKGNDHVFISRLTENYRPAFGCDAIEVTRTLIFIGTSNSDTYFSDGLDNRHLLRIKTTSIDRKYPPRQLGLCCRRPNACV